MVLRVAVIGCGLIAQLVHLPNLLAQPNIEVVVISDRDEFRLSLASRRFSLAVGVGDWRMIAERRDVDAVIVSTDDAAHFDIAIECIRARKHVFIEKPVCLSPAEADLLNAEAEIAGVIAAVGFHKIHDEAVAWLRSELKTQERPFLILGRDICHDNQLVIDDVVQADLRSAEFRAGSTDYAASDLWANIANNYFPGIDDSLADSYRVFLNLACHDVATVINLFGEPSSVLSCEVWDGPRHRSVVTYGFGDGLRFVLTVAVTTRPWFDQSLRIYSDQQTSTVEWPSPFRSDGETRFSVERFMDGSVKSSNAKAGAYSAFVSELTDFVDAINESRAPASSLHLGRQVLRWQFNALQLDYARRQSGTS